MKTVALLLLAFFFAASAIAVDGGLAKKITLLRKIDAIKIPELKLQDEPLENALKTLSNMAESGSNSVNIVLMDADNKSRLTLNLKNVTLRQALNYVAQLSGLAVYVEDEAVFLRKPITENEGASRGGAKSR